MASLELSVEHGVARLTLSGAPAARLDLLPCDALEAIAALVEPCDRLAFALAAPACRRACPGPYRTPLTALLRSAPLLRWAREASSAGEPLVELLDERACATAARSGRLDVLQELRAMGAPWDVRTCAAAAGGGELAVLKWCRLTAEPPCPWDATACSEAAEEGHLELLTWLADAGAPRDVWACAGAALCGRLDALQLCRERGFPWGDEALAGAVEAREIDVVEWLLAKGCPARSQTRIAARRFAAAVAGHKAFSPMDMVTR